MADAKEYPNSGRMFQNEKKEKDSHPDGGGDGEIDCVHCGHKNRFFINGWRKTGAKGPWYSFAFKHKTQAGSSAKAEAPAAKTSATGAAQGYDDSEIPF